MTTGILFYYTKGSIVVVCFESFILRVLNKEFGKGFSVATLTNIRKFYLT